jgi:hypothetical protein
MRTIARPLALAVAIAASALFASCIPGSISVGNTRKEVLAMQLHIGKYGNEIQAAIDSGKLTKEEEELLRGFQSRYATEPFYKGKFPDGITVKAAIRDERKYIHDANPRPHGPFVENDNEAEE